MRAARNIACCMLVAAGTLLQAPLFAQQTDATTTSDPARAVEKGREALALYEQSRWPESLERFRQAEQLYHSPVFVLYTARCLRKLSRLIEARAVLERLVSEALDVRAAAPWQRARKEGRVELHELNKEIPSISIVIQGDSGPAVLAVDGRPVERGRPLELNPGEHRARATDGARYVDATFKVALGSHEQLLLKLPPLAAPLHAELANDVLRKRQASQQSGPHWPGWVLVGTGAAALASGGVVGVLALNRSAYLRDHPAAACDKTQCVSSRKDEVDEHFAPARRLALASDVLWISGSVLAAAGVTLFLIERRPAEAATVTLRVAPGGGSLGVTF